MKYLFLICSLFFTIPNFGQNSTNQFHKDLDFAYEHLKKSASYQTQKEKHQTLEEKYLALKKETQNKESDLFESYIKLYELLDVLVDNHNSIVSNTTSFTYADLQDKDFLSKLKANPEYNFYPKVTFNLDSLQALMSAKPLHDFEGIYYYENYFKIAIYKNRDNLYQGVVLKTKIPSWQPGETILYLLPKEENRFRIFMGSFVDKKLISSMDYFKNGSFKTLHWEKKKPQKDFYNAPNPDEKFIFKKLIDTFSYVKLGTFNSSNSGIKQSKEFYNQISNSLNTPHLIVDLRNNGGGGEKSSNRFYKLLKKYKGKMYVLTNYYTMSNAEQFTLKLKSLKNVVTLGDRSFGMITYGRNYNKDFETPSKRFRIHFTDLKDNWQKYLKYENVGVEPEYYLDSKADWVEQIINEFSNRQ